jgi:hypothetical protein
VTRPRIILGPSGAYWVKAETHKGRPFLGARWSAELLVTTFAYFHRALGFRLYAYAVLPTWFEAVIQPGDGGGPRGSDFNPRRAAPPTISKILMEIKGSFAHWYNRRLCRSGSVWEKRFRDRVLLTAEEIREASLAVHSQPTIMGMTEAPQDYPFCGLGAAKHPLKLVDPLPVRYGSLPAQVGSRAAA